MFSGAYSNRYQILETQQLEQLKQMNSSNRDVIAKARLLSHETNRRRRALAIKRKIDAQREEKRRQDILLKRRERQREATEKFQRCKKNVKGGSSPSSQRSPSPTRGVTSVLIPGLEDALKAVRGTNAGSKPGNTSYASYHADSDRSKHSARKESADALQKAFYNKYGSPPSPPVKDRVKEQAREVAARADLHNRSLRNLTNSRSLFEQQLEQHQQLLLEQQKNSLREFNAAIRKEVEEDLRVQNVEEGEASGAAQDGGPGEEGRAESLSSLDSLEAHCPDKENSFTDVEPVTSDTLLSPAVESGVSHRTAVSTTVRESPGARVWSQGQDKMTGAGVKPHIRGYSAHADSSRSDVTADTVSTIDIRDGSTQPPGAPPKQFFLPRYDVFTDVSSTPQGNRKEAGMPPGATVSDWVDQQNNLLTSGSNSRINGTSTGVDTDVRDNGTFYVKAWAPSSPVGNASGAALKHQNGAPVRVNGAATHATATRVAQPASKIPTQTHTRVRPQSAKPTPAPRGGGGTKGVTSTTPGQPHVTYISISQGVTPHNSDSVAAQNPEPKPVTRPDPPGISNGGLGFSNGVLTLNGDSEQGSDTGSLCRDDRSVSSQDSRKPKSPSNDKEVKSILKKPGMTSGKKSSHFKRSNSFGGKSSSGFDARDSLEVIRLHHKSDDKAKPKVKKSVRFADAQYQDSETSEERETEAQARAVTAVTFSPPQNNNAVTHKPPRPTSAKVMSSPKASPSPSSRRAASAGPVRPTPQSPQSKAKPVVRPQAAAHIITHQSSFTNPVTTATGHQISLVTSANRAPAPPGRAQTTVTRTTSNGTVFEPAGQPGNNRYPPATYDDSGLRLDRTPTDEEINWLWDKVRTCLHRDSQASFRGSDTSADSSARQAVLMSNKLFDGAMLGQHASVTRVSATNLRRYHSAESVNTYSKRNALLQQRQQQPPHSLTSQRSGNKGAPSPKPSFQDPQPTGSNNNNIEEVSESMAGFLAAEALAEQSVSESTIHTAMEAAQQRQQLINTSKPRVPTALSIEEQRLMESIDKLNEKLKISEHKSQTAGSDVTQPHPHIHKAPIVNDDFQWKFEDTHGFRGHQPLVAANKHAVVSPKYHYRTGSGTVTRAKTRYTYY